MTQLSIELAVQVSRYLNGEVNAAALDRWVLERLQTLLDSGDDQAISLANAVDGGLVQLQEGAITKAELHEELRALADPLLPPFIPHETADQPRCPQRTPATLVGETPPEERPYGVRSASDEDGLQSNSPSSSPETFEEFAARCEIARDRFLLVLRQQLAETRR